MSIFKSRVTAVALGAVLIATLGGVGAASAHGPNHGWANSHRIQDNSVRGVDIRNHSLHAVDLDRNAVGSRIIKQGGVAERNLSQGVRESLGAPQGSWHSGEDAVTELTAGERAAVGSLDDLEGSHVVVAHATVSSGAANDNLLCWLVSGGADVAAGNAKDDRESFTLTALVDGPVTMECRTSEADGTATDVSITSVEVTASGGTE